VVKTLITNQQMSEQF